MTSTFMNFRWKPECRGSAGLSFLEILFGRNGSHPNVNIMGKVAENLREKVALGQDVELVSEARRVGHQVRGARHACRHHIVLELWGKKRTRLKRALGGHG